MGLGRGTLIQLEGLGGLGLLKGCLLHRLSQGFIGKTEQASSERAGDKREGRGGGGGRWLRKDSRTLYPTHLRRSFRHRASLMLVSSQYQGKDTGY